MCYLWLVNFLSCGRNNMENRFVSGWTPCTRLICFRWTETPCTISPKFQVLLQLSWCIIKQPTRSGRSRKINPELLLHATHINSFIGLGIYVSSQLSILIKRDKNQLENICLILCYVKLINVHIGRLGKQSQRAGK